MLDVLEEASDANSRAIQEQRNRVVQVLWTTHLLYASIFNKKKKCLFIINLLYFIASIIKLKRSSKNILY